MEPISTGIVAVIAAGATVALKDVANKAVLDAYNGIKSLIIERYNRKGSIEALEEDPASSTAQKLLTEALEKTGADQDKEVIELTNKLLEALNQIPKDKVEDDSIDIGRLEAENVTFNRGTVFNAPVTMNNGDIVNGTQHKTVNINQ